MAAKVAATGAKAKLMKLLGRALDEAMPEDEKPPVTTDADDDVEARIANIEAMLTKISAMCDGTTDELPGDTSADPLQGRLDAIEKALAALAEKMSGNAAVVTDKAPPAAPATDEAPKAIANDAETVARVEILSPGFVMTDKTTVKDVLAEFGKTADGAEVLKTLDSVKDEQALFLTASELMKTKRSVGVAPLNISQFPALARTGDAAKGTKTPEEINAAMAKHYGQK